MSPRSWPPFRWLAGPWHLLGPHAFFDLVRLARRGRSTLVRVLYLLALFAALWVVYEHELARDRRWQFRQDEISDRRHAVINLNAHIAERFSYTILIGQNLAVLILMPIYCATSIFEEHDKRTLPLLFTTHLTSREILLGKLVSRAGHVGSVLLAGLPVLAIIQLWGGIDMPMIAANFWNTGLWILSIGSFSLLVATESDSLFMALLKAYAIPLGIVVIVALCPCCMSWTRHGAPAAGLILLTPTIFVSHGYEWMTILAMGLTVFHVAFASFCLHFARRRLAQWRKNGPPPPEPFDPASEPASRDHDLPPISENPLCWKERFLSPSSWAYAIPGAIATLAILRTLVLFFPRQRFDLFEAVQDQHGNFQIQISILLGISVILLLLVTVRLTGCIIREREQQTLDVLLTLPILPREILSAKLEGCCLRHWFWGLPIVISWTSLLLVGGGSMLAGFGMAVLLAIHLFFFAHLALFLSVFCRSSTAAYVSLALVGLTLLIGTAMLPGLNEQTREWQREIAMVNPIGCWIALADLWRARVPRPAPPLAPIIASSFGYLVVGMCLRVAAYWRFARSPA